MSVTSVKYNLVRSYARTSLAILVVLTLFVGWWVDRTIRSQVIDNTAAYVALYVQSFISPDLQGLAERDQLTEEEIRQLDHLLVNTPLGNKIRSVKVWKPDGDVAYYSHRNLIGKHFDPTENLRRASSGAVSAEFDDVGEGEDSEEAKLGIPLLEIYSPIWQQGSNRVIAVAEFYQDAERLAEQLDQVRNRTWLVVIIIMLIAYALLYGIVRHGGGIISSQRRALDGKVEQLTRLLEKNQMLSGQLRKAVQQTTENNERLLRRVSADLHDGPAQYIGLALLRLDALPSSGDDSARLITSELRGALTDSLTELRYISKGLALPDLEQLSLAEVVENAIQFHRRRTRSEVTSHVDLGPLVKTPGMLVKIAAYRTIQDALTNGYRHAGGAGQRVDVTSTNDTLVLSISDTGPGFEYPPAQEGSNQLGLAGLRERIEGLGGVFQVYSELGSGTTITVKLPLLGDD